MTNWTGGTVADGIDAVATFTNAPVASVPGISLDGNITLGKILFSNDISSSDMSLVSGSSSSNTLTFATSDGTAPMIEVPFATNRLLNLGGTAVLKISGTQGLVFRSAPQTGTFTGRSKSASGTFTFLNNKNNPVLLEYSIQFTGEATPRTERVVRAVPGKALGYALFNLQERGSLFIGHGVEAGSKIYCCATCAKHDGVQGLTDRLQLSHTA